MPQKAKHFLIPDLAATRRDIKTARGLARKPLDLLYSCLKPDPQRSPRDVYDLHWVAVYLLTRDKAAAGKARDAVWIEAMEGGPKSRPGHSWNNRNFMEMHLWIGSAMAAHIAIAMDWLATENVFKPAQIRAMGENFVNNFWSFIYPHLKGRGRSPIYVEPMNQDAAMVTGCLVIGYLFGHKWMRDGRAQRMYADARVMAGNLLGQFYPTGFDNDGFTYMRVIQSPVLALLSMVLEEVEKVDFYNQSYPPNHFSVARFMEKLHTFTLPSGYSFPHGRYGYVTEWNIYSQAYAARKTGDPRYLELALCSGQKGYITPWIAFDLPLAVMWMPYGKTPGTPVKTISVPYKTWHDPLIWSNIALPKHKVFAQLSWRVGKHGTFIAEQGKNRTVFQTGDGAERVNGFRFADVRDRSLAGSGFESFNVGSIQASSIDLSGQWDRSVIRDYRKSMVAIDDGTVLSIDQYTALRPVAVFYQLTTANLIVKGFMKNEHDAGKVQLVCSAAGKEEILPVRMSKKGSEVFQHTTQLEPAKSGFAVALINFDSRKLISDFRSAPNLVQWRKNGVAFSLRPNLDFPAQTEIAPRVFTDSRLEMHTGKGLVLWDAHRWTGAGASLFATSRVNLYHDRETIRVEKMPFGNFLRYTSQPLDISILRGTGYDIYASFAGHLVLILPRPQETVFVHVNGISVKPVYDNDQIVISLKKLPRKTRAVKTELNLSGNQEKTELLTALDTVLTEHRIDMLDQVRALLTYHDTYVRLFAAEVIGWLGDKADAQFLAAKLIEESRRTSPLGGLDAPWFGKWGFFSSVTIMADAIRKLGVSSVVPQLKEALSMQTEPHAKESISLAINTLSDLL